MNELLGKIVRAFKFPVSKAMLGMYESWVLFIADEPLTLIKYKGIIIAAPLHSSVGLMHFISYKTPHLRRQQSGCHSICCALYAPCWKWIITTVYFFWQTRLFKVFFNIWLKSRLECLLCQNESFLPEWIIPAVLKKGWWSSMITF